MRVKISLTQSLMRVQTTWGHVILLNAWYVVFRLVQVKKDRKVVRAPNRNRQVKRSGSSTLCKTGIAICTVSVDELIVK